ncbi:DnaD domain protein [Bacillus aquiflavi]|uniref:DnaD domain protein n=1 Tax=Bacillus aquiflavi TaxID=2672567 RepID=A0A6B3W1G3_9BACI|nr:replication initiation and membrane attachment family protein [Bacillus aquiflavi]MBA4537087.1 DnaD domain protein [Bacillus aquiflavi]NEY81384.1 Replication initiation and membrane attachment protein [Bacillus aquiflavi]
MTQHWQELLPVDHYLVSSDGLLHDYDRKVLSFLYQPLIGSTCFSLYMTLWAQLEENRLYSTPSTHHSLMNLMDMNLKSIYNARLKLEGIGLLKTFVRTEDDVRSFVYELRPPLTPEQFFLDGMLNIYLYKKIGKNQYMRLKQFFSDEKIKKDKHYNEITKQFQDVFASANLPSIQHKEEMIQKLHYERDMQFIGRNEQKSVKITESVFDFDLLLAGLKESLVPKKAFHPKVKEAISKLAFLYGIDPIQMKNIVVSALSIDNEIDIEELRKSARDWYQFEYQDNLPSLVDRIQPVVHHTQANEPKTKEEELIHYLETTSPRQLLVDISGGAEPSKTDLQMIENVMFNQKLLPGVVNVLIQYVMLKTDMKLSKSYVEKIASHWSRKKIKTVKEAMELAKNEHRQYMEWAQGKKESRGNNKKTPIRIEKLPSWFIKQKQEVDQQQSVQNDEADFEMKKRNLEKKLKKYKSGGES